jgi:hypothetical protein
MKIRSLLPFIALNIMVSLLTTLLVLWTWELIRQADTPKRSGIDPISTSTETLPLLTSIPPVDTEVMAIVSIIGAGDLQNEVVRIQRIGTGDLWLTGWQLKDENGNTYLFPQMNFINGSLEVHTRLGVNTPLVLYWNNDRPVWQSGEKAVLVDIAGNLRAQYTVP